MKIRMYRLFLAMSVIFGVGLGSLNFRYFYLCRRIKVHQEYDNHFDPGFLQKGMLSLANALAFIEGLGVSTTQLMNALNVETFSQLMNTLGDIDEGKFFQIIDRLKLVPPPQEWMYANPKPEDYHTWLENAYRWYDYLNSLPPSRQEYILSFALTDFNTFSSFYYGPQFDISKSLEDFLKSHGLPSIFNNLEMDGDFIASLLEGHLLNLIKEGLNVSEIDYEEIYSLISDKSLFWELANKLTLPGNTNFTSEEGKAVMEFIKKTINILKDKQKIPPMSDESIERFAQTLKERFEASVSERKFIPTQEKELLNMADMLFESAKDFEEKDLIEAMDKYCQAKIIYEGLSVRTTLPQGVKQMVDERIKQCRDKYSQLLGTLEARLKNFPREQLEMISEKLKKEAIKSPELAKEVMRLALRDFDENEPEDLQKLRIYVAQVILNNSKVEIDDNFAIGLLELGRRIAVDKSKSERFRLQGLILWMAGIRHRSSKVPETSGTPTRDDDTRMLLAFLESQDVPELLLKIFTLEVHHLIKGTFDDRIVAEMVGFILRMRYEYKIDRSLAKGAIMMMFREMTDDRKKYVRKYLNNPYLP